MSKSDVPVNTQRVRFRIVDLLLVTVVVALTIMAAIEGPIYGKAHSPILLVVLAGILGAVTGRVVSGAFRSGFVGGLLLGVLGYFLAVFALSLGIKVTDKTLFFVCVCAGGVIGGLIPTMLHRWCQASFRRHISILLVGFGLLAIVTFRWWTVSKQTRTVAELQAAGALVRYSDVNPFAAILDSDRMQPRFEWLRELLGLRIVTDVTLPTYHDVDQHYVVQLLVDELPFVKSLSLHADHMDDEVFELLNSGKLSRLEELRFTGRGFGDTSLSRLHPLPSLVLLDLEGTSVTDKSVEHIASFPNLVVLVLDGTSVTDESVDHLTSFPRLKALSVRETHITADGVKRLTLKMWNVVSSN